MIKNPFAMFTAVLMFLGSQVWAAPPHRGGHSEIGGHYVGGVHYRGGYHSGNHRGRIGLWWPGIGIYYGLPGYSFGYGFGYGYPFTHTPLVINPEPMPQVLIQKDSLIGDTAQIEPPTSYWYYCTQPPGYFPYVQNCNQPWMKVVPQIPADQVVMPRVAP